MIVFISGKRHFLHMSLKSLLYFSFLRDTYYLQNVSKTPSEQIIYIYIERDTNIIYTIKLYPTHWKYLHSFSYMDICIYTTLSTQIPIKTEMRSYILTNVIGNRLPITGEIRFNKQNYLFRGCILCNREFFVPCVIGYVLPY